MKVEIDVPLAGLPADRKLSHVVAKYPQGGDYYLNGDEWTEVVINFCTTRIVARFEPIETWRPVTIEDAVKALRGEQIAVRFCDHVGDKWSHGLLSGSNGIQIGRYPLYPWSVRHPDNTTENVKFVEVREFK